MRTIGLARDRQAQDDGAGQHAAGPGAAGHRFAPRQVIGGVLALAVVAVGLVALHDQWPRARHLLAQVGTAGLLAGVVLEAAALLAYTMVARTLLPAATRPPFSVLFRIDLTVYGVSHVVPGGGLTAAALRVRMLNRAGARATDAVVLVAFQGIAGVVVLVALLEATLLAFAPTRIGDPAAVVAAVGALLLAGACAVALLALRNREDWLLRVAGAVDRRLPTGTAAPKGQDGQASPGQAPSARWQEQVHETTARIRALGADRRRLATATGWIAANWMLDAAALWVVLAAYGHHTGPAVLLAAYCLANVLGLLPVTPGGLGVIEAVLISGLVAGLAGSGVPVEIAVIGVLTWRVINFWLPIPVAGLSWLALRHREHRQRRNWEREVS